MANIDQMISVGENCDLYSPHYDDIVSLATSPVTKSCMTCRHFKDGKCQENVFDSVLTSLDTL